jgi:hypothetical protein
MKGERLQIVGIACAIIVLIAGILIVCLIIHKSNLREKVSLEAWQKEQAAEAQKEAEDEKKYAASDAEIEKLKAQWNAKFSVNGKPFVPPDSSQSTTSESSSESHYDYAASDAISADRAARYFGPAAQSEMRTFLIQNGQPASDADVSAMLKLNERLEYYNGN